MTRSYTSSASASAVAVYQYLESKSCDVGKIFSDAGIDFQEINNPSVRVPFDNFELLIRLAIKATDDPGIALQIGEYVHPTSYYPVGISFLSSRTIDEFCRRAQRYSSIYSTNYKIDYISEGNTAWLVNTPVAALRHSDVGYVSIEGWAVVMLRFIRYMYKPDYHPALVRLTTPCAGDLQAYEQHFGCTVEFEADRNGICFAEEDLHIVLPAANADLARQSDQVVMEFLNKMGRLDLLGQVHAKIIDLLPSGRCTMEKVAEAMYMSSRKLHNKLTEANCRFQEVLDDTRRELAEQYMEQSDISVSEIAYMLGFSDCSNFSRSFKRWTGKSPSAYREKKARES